MKRKEIYKKIDMLYRHINDLDLPYKYKNFLTDLILEIKQEYNKETK